MVFEKVKKALSEQLEVDPGTITRETDIIGDLGVDSLDMVELIMSLEDEFGLAVTDESAYEYKTVGDIVDFLESMM